MRTDPLTTLLLDPFLTFGEAMRQCPPTRPTVNAVVHRTTDRVSTRKDGRHDTGGTSRHRPASLGKSGPSGIRVVSFDVVLRGR